MSAPVGELLLLIRVFNCCGISFPILYNPFKPFFKPIAPMGTYGY